MQKFELLLKNDKLRLYYRLNFFVIFISSLLFFYVVFFTQTRLTERQTFILSGLVFLCLMIVAFDPRKKKNYVYAGAYIILGFVWIRLNLYWLAAIVLLLGVLFFLSIRKKRLVVDSDQIVYPSLPKKTFHWSKLSNVVLKDGLLTIDQKNNKLIQQLVDEQASSAHEEEFNKFCRQQLQKPEVIYLQS